MKQLKFEMWTHTDRNGKPNGYMSRFTDEDGISTESWWSSPPSSIDHVGPEYLKYNYRHPNVRNSHHVAFIKLKYKELIKELNKAEPIS